VSIQERVGNRVRFLLVGGQKYDDSGQLKHLSMPLKESDLGKVFPVFQDRSVRPDPLGMRQKYPYQSIGVKVLATLPNRPQLDYDDLRMDHWMIFPELGLDQFDILIDADAWCRIFRYAFMTEDRGFDSRWWSGDYGKHIASCMLLHPNNEFSISNCLQTPKRIVLDKFYFPTSDLFNATFRIGRLHFCIPGSTVNDIRSCDVHVRSDEIVVKTSSELPRTLVNKIHPSQMHFPHDPSDIGFSIGKWDMIGSEGQKGTNHFPTFRSQTNFRGLSIQLSPIVPFLASQEPEQLFLPTDMTVMFCLEERPLSEERNNTNAKMLLMTSVVVHRFEANFDLDMLAAALVTVLFHCNVIKEFASCSYFVSTKLDDANVKVRKSFLDRINQFRRRLILGQKDGGVFISLNFNVIQTRLCLWRQNVLRKPPFQPSTIGSFQIAPLLKLFDFRLNDTVLCIEAFEDIQYRSVVGKLCAIEMDFGCCDFQQCLDSDAFWVESHAELKQSSMSCLSNPEMVQLLAFKATNENGLAIDARFEYRRDEHGSLTFAADLYDGFIDNRVDLVENFMYLLIDALFVPCQFPRSVASDDCTYCIIFPYGTVGYLFATMASRFPSINIPSSVDFAMEDYSDQKYSIKKLGTKILSLVSKLVASTVDIFLFRVGIAKVGLHVSDISLDSGHFRVNLDDCEVFISCVGCDDFQNAGIFDVFAKKQQKWSSLWFHVNEGFCHGVRSRQSVVFVEPGCPESVEECLEESIVDIFSFNYVYSNSKLQFDVTDGISLGNSIKVERLIFAWFRMLHGWMEVSTRLSGRLKMSLSTKPRDNGYTMGAKFSSISVTCLSVFESLGFLENLFGLLKRSACVLRDTSKSALVEKDREIAELRMKVFLKEKERFGTFALFCSDATGWLRIGTAERSGLQGVMSCMLWPHWVILHRSLLLVYTSPGLVR
jgi:hypothetical protein